ncbi:lipopolysaccharide biosynthesis protein [Enterobacter cloacae]|uniref:lipopolysaccharide biosynthesis protein n=1 Tax=Enterobacter cloacae TaxID=550 RepID=UPI002A83D301|nr:lipopolysaccharide biosynthesis protein [Enterobacter cloacae]
MSELKSKTVNGLKWSALERILSQGVQLILMLILARLLGPKAFGLIGMLAIFIAIGQVFIDSGFSSALIRKTDRTDVDYSTAFYFNIIVAFCFYVLLYISSGYIAEFYQQPELALLTKVIGLTLMANSFSVVPRTILTVSMNFKAQAKASICSVVLGGVVALIMAWNGFGVWALVAQTLTAAVFSAVFLNLITRWVPVFCFSKKSFDYLFGFGGKLLISGLLDSAYNNLYQIIIGKRFSAENVGQFTQANQISSIPAMTMTNIIQRVTYPMFSHMQSDQHKMDEYYLLTMKVAALFIFPLMAGVAILAQPLLQLVLGMQWNEAAELVVVLALAYMLYPIHAINLNVLQVKGRSDLFLKLEIIKKNHRYLYHSNNNELQYLPYVCRLVNSFLFSSSVKYLLYGKINRINGMASVQRNFAYLVDYNDLLFNSQNYCCLSHGARCLADRYNVDFSAWYICCLDLPHAKKII